MVGNEGCRAPRQRSADRQCASRRLPRQAAPVRLLLLAGGIAYHVSYMVQLRRERALLAQEQLIHAETSYPYSLSLMTALVLFVLGIVALVGVGFGAGPLA